MSGRHRGIHPQPESNALSLPVGTHILMPPETTEKRFYTKNAGRAAGGAAGHGHADGVQRCRGI